MNKDSDKWKACLRAFCEGLLMKGDHINNLMEHDNPLLWEEYGRIMLEAFRTAAYSAALKKLEWESDS